MSFVVKALFPGMLLDSATRWARDAAGRYPEAASTQVIGELGWNAVLVPESAGGAGGSFSDFASIVEGLATHAVALPVVTRCGIVPTMLDALADGDAARSLLAAVADGSAIIELGGSLNGQSEEPLLAREQAGKWELSGCIPNIALTEECTHALLVARNAGDGSPMVFIARRQELDGEAAAYTSMDERGVCAYRMESMSLPASAMLASGAEAARAIEAGWRLAVCATAADTVCAMGSALEHTIAYLRERHQFGQSLSRFQVLRHDVARLYIIYELARGLLQASLDTMQAPLDSRQAKAAFDLLGLFTGQEAIRFAEMVIQLHGGMGMTKELPAARLATRMLANALRFDDPLSHLYCLHDFRTKTRP